MGRTRKMGRDYTNAQQTKFPRQGEQFGWRKIADSKMEKFKQGGSCQNKKRKKTGNEGFIPKARRKKMEEGPSNENERTTG